jgi:hypothetical protein
MQKNVLDTAANWLLVLGPTIIGIAGGVYYGGSKVVAVWMGFAGCALLLLAAALQWQQHIRGAEADIKRPIVSVIDAGIITKRGDTAPTVFVIAKNTGQATADGLTWRAAFAMRSYPDTGNLALDQRNVAPNFDLPPGGTLSYEWKFTEWGEGNWDLVKSGRGAIFAYGEIRYRNADSTSGRLLCTNYRLYHGGDSMAPEGKFAIAKEGNGVDKGCGPTVR